MSTAENQICYTQDSKLWPRGNRSRGKRVAISKHISTSRSDHQGMRYIRLVQSFQVEGQFGSHVFLVFEPLREPIWRLGRHLGSIGVPPVVLKPFLGVLLEGLDFLHSECGIIHTDLKADNLLIAFEDVRVIRNYARQQKLDPPLHVFWDGRPVWQSRPDFEPLKKGTGLLKISDFSAAVSGNVPRAHAWYTISAISRPKGSSQGWLDIQRWYLEPRNDGKYYMCLKWQMTYWNSLIVMGAAGRCHSPKLTPSSRRRVFPRGPYCSDDKTFGEATVPFSAKLQFLDSGRIVFTTGYVMYTLC